MTVALMSPQTYDASNRWLAARVNLPTSMGSKEIALSPEFADRVRSNAFFSAKVAETHILDRLREVSDRYSRGETDLATARNDLKNFLWGEGYPREDIVGPKGAGRAITNLASTARLNLILDQNARMASAVAQREFDLDPDVMAIEPYFQYLPSTSVNQRQDHIQFYNIVLPKADPFWFTHTPPLGFRCKCGLRGVDREEAAALGGAGTAKPRDPNNPDADWTVTRADGSTINVPRDPSGYVFDVESAFGTCDMSRIGNDTARKRVLDDMAAWSNEQKVDIRCTAGPRSVTAPVDNFKPDAAKTALDTARAELKTQTGKKALLPGNAETEIGTLHPDTAAGLGLPDQKITVKLVTGTRGRGLNHMLINHRPDIEDGTADRALTDAMSSPGIVTMINFRGGRGFLNLFNPVTKALVTLSQAVRGKWLSLEVLSAYYDADALRWGKIESREVDNER